jgi:acyl carrier protein
LRRSSVEKQEKIMSDEEIIGLIKAAVSDTHPKPEKVLASFTPTSSLSDLGIDSVNALEMAGYVEDKLGLRFPDGELAHVDSIPSFVSLVKRSTGAGTIGKDN